MNLLVLLVSSVLLGGLIAALLLFTQQRTGGAASAVANLAAPLGPARPTILLLGPSGSGKTALFNALAHTNPSATNGTVETAGETKTKTSLKPTYTSQDYNATDYRPSDGAKLRLVDIPGHPKVHGAALASARRKEGRPKLRGVVFLLDAATLEKHASAVANELVRAVDAARRGSANADVPVLVCGNKADLFTAVDADEMRDVLEREIEAIRVSRRKGTRIEGMSEREGAGAGRDDDETAPDAWLDDGASEKTAFTFAQHDIKLGSSSVLKGDVKAIEEFISAVA